MNNARHLKKVLLQSISTLAQQKEKFLFNPCVDFTRKRKLSFDELIKFVICMESGTIKDELYKYFGLSGNGITASALIQQRSKIKYEAFKYVFEVFNEKTIQLKSYKGYRLIAVDGSTLPISTDISDSETYSLNRGKNEKGYNAFHLHASYDLLEHTYDDIIIEGEAKYNENAAFIDIVDRYNGKKAIFIADRNYESYNLFEHVSNSNNKFLIRIKDLDSNGMLKGMHISLSGECDVDVSRILTFKQTKEVKEHPEKYRFFPKNIRFDYLDNNVSYYQFKCRIVRIKISDDNYECIATNLERDEFPLEEIKKLYNMRWGIETAFRELKYAIGLNAFHAKKRGLIKQEIYARLILHNFCERIIRKIKIPKKERKYQYQVNFTRSIHILRSFLRINKGGKHPPDIESILSKEIEPIRHGRTNSRKIKPKSVVYFTYRFN